MKEEKTKCEFPIRFYLGEISTEKELNDKCKEFNNNFCEQKYSRTAKYEAGYLIISSSVEMEKYKDKDILREKTVPFTRFYYPFFYDFIKKGTCFIDYIYVCVVVFSSGIQLPFVINGPFLQINEHRYYINHWVHCIPLTWFPSLPDIINVYKKNISLKRYYEIYNKFVNNNYDIDRIEKITLYGVDLLDDFYINKIESMYKENGDFEKFHLLTDPKKNYYSSHIPTCLTELLKKGKFSNVSAQKNIEELNEIISNYLV